MFVRISTNSILAVRGFLNQGLLSFLGRIFIPRGNSLSWWELFLLSLDEIQFVSHLLQGDLDVTLEVKNLGVLLGQALHQVFYPLLGTFYHIPSHVDVMLGISFYFLEISLDFILYFKDLWIESIFTFMRLSRLAWILRKS